LVTDNKLVQSESLLEPSTSKVTGDCHVASGLSFLASQQIVVAAFAVGIFIFSHSYGFTR
jgi:hypothetical protein